MRTGTHAATITCANARCDGCCRAVQHLGLGRNLANELARSGDAGVGALCRYAQASGLIRHRIRLTDCMCHHIIHHLSSHASHPIKGNHPSHKRVYVQSLLFHISQFSRALSAGKAPRPARLRHARREDGILSSQASCQQTGSNSSPPRRRIDPSNPTCIQPGRFGRGENQASGRDRKGARADLLPHPRRSITARR